jgi:hypothetical protein
VRRTSALGRGGFGRRTDRVFGGRWLGSAATPRTDAVAIAARFVWLLVGVIPHLCGRLILLRIKE